MNAYKAELKLFSRTGMARWLLGLYVATGFACALLGQAWTTQQQQNDSLIGAHYQHQLERFTDPSTPMDPGLISYYLAAPAVQPASPWAALISGQRAEQRTHNYIRLLAVQGQLYGGELHNHQQQRLGRLDLAFVWLYLLPLLIGVLCVNVAADDTTHGRWALVATQVKSEWALIGQRLILRFVLITCANIAVLTCASFIAGVEFNYLWWSILGLLLLYQAFWFLVAAAVIALNKAPTVNVLTFLALWLLWAFVLPALAYLTQMNTQQLNDGARLVVEQRQLMNDSWDRDKQADLNTFLQNHPQWADTSPITGRFAWNWYYAMQQTSDEAVAEIAERYSKAQSELASRVRLWRWLSPTLNLQVGLARLADTDEIAYQNYIQQIVAWHGDMREFWYPYFFFDRAFTTQQLQDLPQFNYQPGPPGSALYAALPLFYWCLFLMAVWYGRAIAPRLFLTSVKGTIRLPIAHLRNSA